MSDEEEELEESGEPEGSEELEKLLTESDETITEILSEVEMTDFISDCELESLPFLLATLSRLLPSPLNPREAPRPGLEQPEEFAACAARRLSEIPHDHSFWRDLLTALEPYPLAIVIALGDLYVERGDLKAALQAYSASLGRFPLQLPEAGYALTVRARLSPEPLRTPPAIYYTSSPYFDSRCQTDLLKWGLGEGPSHDLIKQDLVGLALRAFGLTYHWLLEIAAIDKDEARSVDEYALEHMTHTLDGLNVLFAELGDYDAMGLVVAAYNEWPFHPPADSIDMRISITESWLGGRAAGRDAAEAVQQAVEDARRTVVLGNPDAFADAVAESVAQRLAGVGDANRDAIEAQLRLEIADWPTLPTAVRQQLVSADYLYGAIGQGWSDFSGPVVLFGKAIEGLLRDVLGTKKWTLDQLEGRQSEQLLAATLKGTDSAKRIVPLVLELKNLRNRAAHADGGWMPLKKHECERARQLALLITDGVAKYRK